MFAVTYNWKGSNTDEAKQWLARITDLVPSPDSGTSIESKTPLLHVQQITQMLDASVIGSPQTVSFSNFSDQVISAVSSYAATMPSDPCTAIVFHSLRGKSCRSPFPESVWRYREPHYLVEILGYGSSPEAYALSKMWAVKFRQELSQADSVLEGTYYSLTSSSNLNLEKIFGEQLNELRRLKEEYDPQRVFKHAIPGL